MRSSSSCFVAVAAALVLAACESPGALDGWPATLTIQSGNFQTGLVGYALNEPPAVLLRDAAGNPLAGAPITFTVLEGGGTLTGGVVTTGSDGVASAGGWSVGLGPNRLHASIPAPFRVPPVIARATGAGAAFEIGVAYLSAVPPGRRAAFDTAAARWKRMIYGDVRDFAVSLPGGLCLGNEPPISGTIDDVIIFVTLDSIDGPGRVLGGAAPCVLRPESLLPLVGVMVFDTADVAMLEQLALFDEVIMHEMGHVLGFGTLWHPQLLALLGGGGTSDPHFVGARGRAAFDRTGGTSYVGGAKVPVENTGGPGTIDRHWRESAFDRELMTGYLDAGGANPLSVTTVAAMEDEGYRVNYAAADPFTLSFAAAPRAPGGPARAYIALGDDVLRLPVHVVDATGRVVRVHRW